MIKQLIERQDDVQCNVCKCDGQRLVFDNGTTEIQHSDTWNDKYNCYIPVVHFNG